MPIDYPFQRAQRAISDASEKQIDTLAINCNWSEPYAEKLLEVIVALSQQGKRILKCWDTKDLHQIVHVPTGHATLSAA